MWIPVISLLQKLLQTLKFAHLQVSFICVLVANKCTAVRGESRAVYDLQTVERVGICGHNG